MIFEREQEGGGEEDEEEETKRPGGPGSMLSDTLIGSSSLSMKWRCKHVD